MTAIVWSHTPHDRDCDDRARQGALLRERDIRARDNERVEHWTCPDCDRPFARAGQGHDCAPGMSIEEFLATSPSHERPVVDAVIRHVNTLGPVHLDPVSVGIFLKNPRKFAELRTMSRWVALGFSLRRRAVHPTITRKVVAHGHRFWHVANIASPEQLDDDLLQLITEAYETVGT